MDNKNTALILYQKNKTPTYLYILYDPTYVSNTFYVGITYDPITRLKDHIRDKENEYKKNWINKLSIRNIKPAMKIIELFVYEKIAEAAEINMIAFLRSIDVKLCNIAPGGNVPPHKTGEDNFNAKLNKQQVSEIRHAFFNEKIGRQELADKYKISITNIKDILRYKIWFNDIIIPNNIDELIEARNREILLAGVKYGEENASYGMKRTPEQIKNISNAHLGQVAWNKGHKKIKTQEEIVAKAEIKRIKIEQGKISKSLKLRGENSATALLNEKDVLEIRKLYAAGGITYLELGNNYKVTKHCIFRIIKRYNWKHI